MEINGFISIILHCTYINYASCFVYFYPLLISFGLMSVFLVNVFFKRFGSHLFYFLKNYP